MERHDEADVGRWTDERMNRLTPDAEWEPNVARGLGRLRVGRETVRPWRRRRMWMAAGAIATVVFVSATPMARAIAERCGELVYSLTGYGASRAYVVRSQRQPTPELTLPDASGRPVRLSDFRGKVVLLNFWTTACRQCDREIPWFVEFQQKYRNNLVVFGVSVDKDGWETARSYVEGKSIPTTWLIDKWGRIAVTHTGFCTKGEYESDLQTLLGEN